MNLEDWMKKHGKSDDDVAFAAGVTRPYINRVRHGLVNPSLSVALRIWNYTERAIDLEYLLPRDERAAFARQQQLAKRRARDTVRKRLATTASRSLATA